jgi:GH24 family phage-related lysozyme (muramidase)
MPMTAREYACALITMHEAFVPKPYHDPLRPNIVTVGYGTTFINGHPVDINMPPITKEQGIIYIALYIDEAAREFDPVVPHFINECELGALISIAYNEGMHAILTSTMMVHIKEGSLMRAAVEFPLWCYGGGKFSQGLLNRRISEQYTFLSSQFIRDPGTDYKLLPPPTVIN